MIAADDKSLLGTMRMKSDEFKKNNETKQKTLKKKNTHTHVQRYTCTHKQRRKRRIHTSDEAVIQSAGTA